MNLFFYKQLLRLGKPLLLHWLEKKARRAGGDWQLDSDRRYGRYVQLDPARPEPMNDTLYNFKTQEFSRPVWVHAVSLGETRAAQPLIRALLDAGYPVLLTHMTPTGMMLGRKLFGEAMVTGQLVQTWMPYDFAPADRGFLEHWKPRCGLLIEREVWPNMIHEANKLDVPMILVSARLSDSSLRTAKWMGSVMKKAYGGLALTLTQTRDDKLRLLRAGVKNGIEVVGNLKFDLQLSHSQVHFAKELRRVLNRPIVALASIRENEEVLFIQEIARLKELGKHLPLFVLIPRHPQTYTQCRNLLGTWSLNYVVRSEGPIDAKVRAADVLLGDTVGEMYFYYALSDVAVIGGSFLPYGGQNHIEACALGVPVILGPHTENFAQAADDALFAGAARRVENAPEALQVAMNLLSRPSERESMGQAGKDWLSLHEGATRRIMRAIYPYLN